LPVEGGIESDSDTSSTASQIKAKRSVQSRKSKIKKEKTIKEESADHKIMKLINRTPLPSSKTNYESSVRVIIINFRRQEAEL